MNPLLARLKEEIAKAVIGQHQMVDGLLIGLLCQSHILVEGVPGLAKTTAINALSKVLGIDFKRIQFTPDLLPSDIIGAQIYDPQRNAFQTKRGPLFTHLLLADEINRAPSKVQSALLEAMQERQVTIGEKSYTLPHPFLVMATQNPIEQEGVYPLPEAQLDRFMMKLRVSYNNEEEELQVMRLAATRRFEPLCSVLDKEELERLMRAVDQVHIDPQVERYIIELVTATREPSRLNLQQTATQIMYGASTRAAIDLHRAARAKALLLGRDHVTPVDVGRIAHDVLRHRIVLSYEARAEEITTDAVISELLQAVPIP
jgi:MoxR-like ATPase